MKKIFIFALFAFALGILYACSDDDDKDNEQVVEPELPKLDIPNLRQAPFKFGGAININALKTDEKYREIVVREFNSITAENVMKMAAISRGRGAYDYTDADYLVDFALQNNMRVHGHTLIWHNSIPNWLNSFSGNKEQWKDVMKQYIRDVVTHFKGKATSWDVVNEAIMDDGTYRNSIWLKNIGTEYIELAFQYAHEADPDAILFYNEYGTEYSHAKNVAVNKMIDELIAKAVPIHGIGMQMHTDIYKQENQWKYAIRAAAAHNLKVHVSELDIATNPDKEADVTFTDELAEKQQISYRYVIEGMMDIPADQQFGITFWGVTDNYSWLHDSPDWVLPFSDKYEKKTAYDGILQGLYKK
jgi:endo-1,4-beta-xylanase